MLVSPFLVLLWLGMATIALLAGIVAIVLIWLAKLWWNERSDPLRDLRGLEASFFEPLCGLVTSADPRLHNEWVENLGQTFRFNGFGKFDYRLMTTDVRSLAHILTSPIYEKPWQTQRVLASFLGRGLSVMEGKEHARQRKVVAPAFSPQNVRRFYSPIFVEKAAELCDAWNAAIVQANEPTTIDVAHWSGRATLDVIGLASFDHNFNALQHENQEIYLGEILRRRMFDGINKGPDLRYLLDIWIPWLAKYWPGRLTRTIHESLRVIHQFGTRAVHTRRRLALYESPEKGFGSNYRKTGFDRDLLSRLVDANTDPATRFSERLTGRELLDQINTFLFGGSDSTGLAIAWSLHFLALNPSIQSRLRDELLSHSLSPDLEERASQIDALPFLDCVVKEALRLSPPIHSTIRVATQDDVIPLSEPLVLRDGKITNEVRIKKGSFIHIPLEGFNTSTYVWGCDATLFNPDRWSNLPPAAKLHPGLGGMLTFSFGGHACLGWKFAITETKTFVASLMLQFVFTPSDDIQRENIILQRPYIKNKWDLGPKLPLNVAIYTSGK